jgi:hypothetical protein
MKQPTFKLQYDPAEIRKLADRYMAVSAEDDRKMEEAGQRIARGEFSRANLEIVCGWKSRRRLRLLDKNTDKQIEQALNGAISSSDVKDAVCPLTALAGIGVKMASAILTAIDPGRYTALDYRALEALGLEDSDDLDLYMLYLDACLSMSKKHGVTMRTFDRANWQWSKCKEVCGPFPCR